jgi:hypothetical protein
MTLDELYKIVGQFPMADVQEDLDGQIIIYTGLMYDAPLGHAGSPVNSPHNRRDVDLRDMNEGDLPDAKI